MKHNKVYYLFALITGLSLLLAACQPAAIPPAAASESTATVPPAPAAATSAPEAPEAPAATATSAPVAAATSAPVSETNRTGGWLDEIDFSAIADAAPAVAQLQAGAVDGYPAIINKTDVFATVKADPNLTYSMQYGSFNQLLFNTVACTDTNLLNPFTDMKIREAMNWALDRNYVVQEIYGGLAVAKYTILSTSFPDYARYTVEISQIINKYGYNLDQAQSVVDTEMATMGASKGADGKWQFKGKPVVIIGLIRTEDHRKEIGDYFGGQLEKLGFTVDRQFKVAQDASPIWQGAPEDCKFTYYTAGWISPAISRDQGSLFAQYSSGDIQNIPLFLKFTPSPAYKDVITKLENNDFNTLQERDDLFKQALTMGMQESWWGVLVNDNITFEPYRKDVTVASDLAGGIAAATLWPNTLRFTGKEGGTLKLAQSSILVNPWNPILGSNWVSDTMIQRGTMDRAYQIDPYTGLILPQRMEKASLVAVQGLPIRKTLDWIDLQFVPTITVPEDTWVDWDATKQTFITAKEKYPNGLTAKTKGTVVYPSSLWQTKWHDGSNLSPADFVMNIIMGFDPAKEASKIYDPAEVPGFESFMSHFKGVRITSTDPLIIETYDDSYALDAELNVTTWYPAQAGSYGFGTAAWHNLTPAVMAEADGKLAFSNDKAQANNVEWTSLIAGPSLDIEKTYLDQALKDAYIPFAPTLTKYITPADATARYTNLENWYSAHSHLWIGTGPYYVDKVFPVEGSVTLKHFDSFPDPADRWSNFGQPMIASATVDGPGIVATDTDATFDVNITFNNKPYLNSNIDKVNYLVFDDKGEMIAQGDATPVTDGHYQVVLPPDVTSKFTPGSDKLQVVVTSKVVSLPTFVTFEFVTQ